ncbi:hypothetical protein GOBAR_DD24745 [Gossypium barbadense]|nr:hypothetical protein GOBAR_DD24745 [Gossypium barbadense]
MQFPHPIDSPLSPCPPPISHSHFPSSTVPSSHFPSSIDSPPPISHSHLRLLLQIEAVGLFLVLLWIRCLSKHHVVEWESGKEGCTIHVSPDQLWPHTKRTLRAGKLTERVLKLFIDTGKDEVFSLIQALNIRVTLTPVLPTRCSEKF